MTLPRRVLVTGSRDWRWPVIIQTAFGCHVPIGATVVHGACPTGADAQAAELWAPHGPVEPHPADWRRYGKRAGFVRNRDMVNSGADLCLAFVLNASPGATMCVDMARQAGIPVIRYGVSESDEQPPACVAECVP